MLISIHAPRAGSDPTPSPRTGRIGISIHAPRAGSDLRSMPSSISAREFQSTLPVRGATLSFLLMIVSLYQISIHAPRAGSDLPVSQQFSSPRAISIHAPRAGSDLSVMSNVSKSLYFNPRSPCGERQAGKKYFVIASGISIHAPRAGSDGLCGNSFDYDRHFNPRSPCGERRGNGGSAVGIGQARSPCGERPRTRPTTTPPRQLGKHAPRAGSDMYYEVTCNGDKNVGQARSPCGERLLKFESLFGFSNNSCMVIRFLAAPSSLL